MEQWTHRYTVVCRVVRRTRTAHRARSRAMLVTHLVETRSEAAKKMGNGPDYFLLVNVSCKILHCRILHSEVEQEFHARLTASLNYLLNIANIFHLYYIYYVLNNLNNLSSIYLVVQCPTVSKPVNGLVTCTSGANYNSLCRFVCDEGFEMRGSTTRVCQDNGQFSGVQPICECKHFIE